MNRTYAMYAVIFLAGVVLANKARMLPLVNKLPNL